MIHPMTTGDSHVHEAKAQAPTAQVKSKRSAIYQLQFAGGTFVGQWVCGLLDAETAIATSRRQHALLFIGGEFLDGVLDNSMLVAHMIHESSVTVDHLGSLTAYRNH